MMLQYSLGLEQEAAAVERAVAHVIAGGARTADLGGDVTTREMGDLIAAEIGR
jgi:3-isopropylmalate dehydrogenase